MKGSFSTFDTRLSETLVSYKWDDKFSEPHFVPDPRNPTFKFLLTATILKILPFAQNFDLDG